jgi:hypothetical protein
MHTQFAEGYGFDQRMFERGRSTDGRQTPDERRNPRRPDVGGDHGFERGLALARPGASPPVPFGRAMRDLYRDLGRAEELYNGCLTEFDNEVATIRGYTDANTLANMWASKVDGVRDPRNFPADEEAPDANGQRLRQRFTEMEERIRRAFHAAISSTLHMYPPATSDRKQARHRASERLKQKIHLELEQLLNVMEHAKESREECRHLVHELQQFRNAVNPEEQMNQELYRPSDDDEDINVDEQDEAGA